MRYYSTQRPVGPGTYPKPQGNAVKEVFNFDSKTYCEEVGREAWGYIEYEKPLDPETAAGYALVADGVAARAASMRRPAGIWTAAGIVAATRPESRETSTSTARREVSGPD